MKRLVLVLMMIAIPAWARPTLDLVTAIRQVFTPADDGRSFVSSQVPLDMNKVRGFAVIRKGGIPAGQAYWFITHQDYEYRPFIIKGDIGKTYLGKVEVALQPGTVMAIASTDVFQKTIEIKLLSKDVIAAKDGTPTRHDTRAAVAMVFKFPGLSMTAADAPTILAKIQEYIAPADSLAQAEQVAAQIQGGGAPAVVHKTAVPIAAPPPVPAKTPAATAPKTSGVVQAGMNYGDVKRIEGDPKRTITRGNTVIFDYGDHEVIFSQEKVSDIRWK